jgi:long-subunit fatty acid transport protein
VTGNPAATPASNRGVYDAMSFPDLASTSAAGYRWFSEDLVRIALDAAAFASSLALSAGPAMAAGFWLYEMGTPDLGTASAGRAASAQDAATVFGNPAGMTSLDRSQLLVGTQLVVGDIHFNRDSGTTVAGGNGGNASGGYPARRSITRTA